MRGRRHRLDQDKDAAFEAWHRLASGDSGGTEFGTAGGSEGGDGPTRGGGGLTVGDLIGRYLEAHAGWAGAHTRVCVASQLGLLRRSLSERPVDSLRPSDFYAVADARGWAVSSRSAAKRRWAACCNWAIREGLLDANPLKGLRTGAVGSRRGLVLPSGEQVERLLSGANPELRDVLVAVLDTGCRPSEAFRVTAADVDGDRWRLAAGKNGKPRTVYLTERVRRRCEELAVTNPTGPLYRRARGRPWPLYTCEAQNEFRRLRRRCGLPAGLTLYSFRHLFATEASAKGLPDSVVAELLGNTTAILQRHYVHLSSRADSLRDGLRRVRGAG